MQAKFTKTGETSMKLNGRFVTVLVSVTLCFSLAASAGQPTIVTFDPQGSTATYVEQINPSGTIIGYYQDARSVFHAFLRSPNGKITSYDAPGAGAGAFQGTSFVSINPSGDLVGQTIDSNNLWHVFLLTAKGFTKFDAPDAGTGVHQGTFGWNINPRGEIAGAYVNSGDVFQGTQVWHSYVRAPDGTVTEYDAPGAGTSPGQGTEPCANDCLNPAGTVAGAYIDPTSVSHTFVRDRHGNITEFDPPGASSSGPSGIDPVGSVVGSYSDSNGVGHGFLREKNGSIIDIDVPGAGTASGQGTIVNTIATNGGIAGYYVDANGVYHGFARSLSGTITPFDVPGAGKGTGQGTIGYSNTPAGAVAGYYIDGAGVQHGFLWIQCDDDSKSVAEPIL
jgi:hypothetical protein